MKQRKSIKNLNAACAQTCFPALIFVLIIHISSDGSLSDSSRQSMLSARSLESHPETPDSSRNSAGFLQPSSVSYDVVDDVLVVWMK